MIRKNRITPNIIVLLLLFTAVVQCLSPGFRILASTVPAPPIVNADSVFIMEGRTGQELYSKKAEEPIYTDSLLPMLISMAVLDEKNIDDFILISEEAQGMNTRITGNNGDAGLTAGERLTIRQLLSAVLLANSQDASRALAGIFQEEDLFLERIRAKAEELKLESTVIESYLAGEASGKTTPRDMALAMQALLSYPQLTELARQPSYTFIPNNMVPQPRVIENRNAQVLPEDDMYLEHAAAGFLSDGASDTGTYNMFITAVESGDSQFIVSLSDSSAVKDNFSNSRALFDWAGNNYRSVHLISQGETMSYHPLENGNNLDLIAARDVYFLAPREMSSDPDFSLNFKPLDDPGDMIMEGQVMGTADIVITEKVIATIDLLADTTVNLSVPAESMEEPLWTRVLRWTVLFLLIALFLAIIVLIIRTVNMIRRTRRKLRRIHDRQEQLLSAEEEAKAMKEEQQVINRSNF